MNSQKLRYFLIVVGLLIGVPYWPGGRCATEGKKSTDKPLKFWAVAMGDSVDPEATKAGFRTVLGKNETRLGFTDFKASDGVIVLAEDGQFRSPEEAERYLDFNVARSSRILTRGVNTDSTGKRVGLKAEVVLASDRKDSAVLWTNGAWFNEVTSHSLADAEEFAKRHGG